MHAHTSWSDTECAHAAACSNMGVGSARARFARRRLAAASQPAKLQVVVAAQPDTATTAETGGRGGERTTQQHCFSRARVPWEGLQRRRSADNFGNRFIMPHAASLKVHSAKPRLLLLLLPQIRANGTSSGKRWLLAACALSDAAEGPCDVDKARARCVYARSSDGAPSRGCVAFSAHGMYSWRGCDERKASTHSHASCRGGASSDEEERFDDESSRKEH